MKTAVYAGTFDPITFGHLDVMARAAKIFDRLIVAVSVDNYKENVFSLQERMNFISEVTKEYPNLQVESFTGLLVDFCLQKKATVIIRGLRAVSDFEQEFQMALMNRKVGAEIDTVFLMSAPEYLYISSSLIKRYAALGGKISDMVPTAVEKALQEKFAKTKFNS